MIRLTVNIADESADLLQDFMRTEGVTATDAISSLLAFGRVVWQAEKQGKTIRLHSGLSSEEVKLIRRHPRGRVRRRHLSLVVPWRR